MLVCRDDGVPADPSPPGALGAAVRSWVDRTHESGVRVTAGELADEGRAPVVRNRGEQTQVTEAPAMASSGALLGFDVLVCPDLERAVAIAAAHPLATRFALEVLPLADDEDV